RFLAPDGPVQEGPAGGVPLHAVGEFVDLDQPAEDGEVGRCCRDGRPTWTAWSGLCPGRWGWPGLFNRICGGAAILRMRRFSGVDIGTVAEQPIRGVELLELHGVHQQAAAHAVALVQAGRSFQSLQVASFAGAECQRHAQRQARLLRPQQAHPPAFEVLPAPLESFRPFHGRRHWRQSPQRRQSQVQGVADFGAFRCRVEFQQKLMDSMASRAGPRAAGSDGSDFVHREVIELRHRISSVLKPRVRVLSFIHSLLLLAAGARVFARPASLPSVTPADLAWLASGLAPMAALLALPRNRTWPLRCAIACHLACGLAPIVWTVWRHAADLHDFVSTRRDEYRLPLGDLPYTPVLYLFLSVCLQSGAHSDPQSSSVRALALGIQLRALPLAPVRSRGRRRIFACATLRRRRLLLPLPMVGFVLIDDCGSRRCRAGGRRRSGGGRGGAAAAAVDENSLDLAGGSARRSDSRWIRTGGRDRPRTRAGRRAAGATHFPNGSPPLAPFTGSSDFGISRVFGVSWGGRSSLLGAGSRSARGRSRSRVTRSPTSSVRRRQSPGQRSYSSSRAAADAAEEVAADVAIEAASRLIWLATPAHELKTVLEPTGYSKNSFSSSWSSRVIPVQHAGVEGAPALYDAEPAVAAVSEAEGAPASAAAASSRRASRRASSRRRSRSYSLGLATALPLHVVFERLKPAGDGAELVLAQALVGLEFDRRLVQRFLTFGQLLGESLRPGLVAAKKYFKLALQLGSLPSLQVHVVPVGVERVVKRLDSLLLAGQVGPGVAALLRQVEHLGQAFVPHLAVGLCGQAAVLHALRNRPLLRLKQLGCLGQLRLVELLSQGRGRVFRADIVSGGGGGCRRSTEVLHSLGTGRPRLTGSLRLAQASASARRRSSSRRRSASAWEGMGRDQRLGTSKSTPLPVASASASSSGSINSKSFFGLGRLASWSLRLANWSAASAAAAVPPAPPTEVAGVRSSVRGVSPMPAVRPVLALSSARSRACAPSFAACKLRTGQHQFASLYSRLREGAGALSQQAWQILSFAFLCPLFVLLPRLLLLLAERFSLNVGQFFKIARFRRHGVFAADVVETDRRLLLERRLLVVVDWEFLLGDAVHSREYAGRAQLAPLLQRGETARFLQLLLAGLALGFLALPGLGQHLQLVLVHIDGVRLGGLVLRTGIDLAGSQPPRVVIAAFVPHLGLVDEELVALQALGGCAANYRRNGAPLGGHQLGHVDEFLVLLAGPFGLFNTGIQPFVPAGFALLSGFAVQQRGNSGPLVFAVFHYGRLENLILRQGVKNRDDLHQSGRL
uniref:Guanylate cyclase domain-containing protein n=1 Tax=Macrostomum lignano TaxID=282301 RepID=A0A1I8HLX8_9PLAT